MVNFHVTRLNMPNLARSFRAVLARDVSDPIALMTTSRPRASRSEDLGRGTVDAMLAAALTELERSQKAE